MHSGEVVALASPPDYDPNHREQALDKDRLNRISFGTYEMGSVFKVFTVAGVLNSGSGQSSLALRCLGADPLRVVHD